jgi:hypothetical protein
MANNAQNFKAPHCERDRRSRVRLLKKCAAAYSHKSNLAATLSKSQQNSSTPSSAVASGLAEARRHELDKFRERVAVVEPEFRSTSSKGEKPFRRAGYGVGK